MFTMEGYWPTIPPKPPPKANISTSNNSNLDDSNLNVDCFLLQDKKLVKDCIIFSDIGSFNDDFSSYTKEKNENIHNLNNLNKLNSENTIMNKNNNKNKNLHFSINILKSSNRWYG